MAKNTTAGVTWFGNKWHARQMKLAIPGGPDGDSPGLLFLESVDSSKTPGGVYLWADSTGALRFSTLLPTNEDGDGQVIGATASSSANQNLSNIASTAISDSLIPDADSTDNLGSSAAYWKYGYIDRVYLNATSYIDGAAAGFATFTGGIVVGVNDTGYDVQFFGDTATRHILWDASADSLISEDNVKTVFGTGSDVSITWDGTDLEFDFAAANSQVQFGASQPSDLILHGGTAGRDLFWDASGNSLIALDSAIVAIGTGSDIKIQHDGTDTHIDGRAANEVLRIGDAATVDLWLHGADYDVEFDASANTLTVRDNALLCFGDADDITIKWDATDLLIEAAAANSAIKIGATTHADLYVYGETATNYIHFNTDDTAKVMSLVNFTQNFANGTLTYTTAWSTNSLVISANDNAGAKLIFGSTGTNGMDFQITGAISGHDWLFNAGTSTMTYQGIFEHADTEQQLHTENDTMTAADSGIVHKCATDGVVFTLPATAAGLTYTFMNAGADGAAGISVSPHADDKIMGVNITAADNKDLINTKGTAKKGDFVRLVGDGSLGWYVQAIGGIWARESD